MHEELAKWADAVDKLRDAVDNERLPRNVRGLLEDDLESSTINEVAGTITERCDALRERADLLEASAATVEALANTVETALDAVDGWEGATGQDKRDAREELFGSLTQIADAFDDLEQPDPEEMEEP